MLNNSKTALKRIIVLFLIITLTYYNFAMVGSKLIKGLISYAVDEENTQQTEITIEDESSEEPVFSLSIDSEDMHKNEMDVDSEFTEDLKLTFNNVEDTAQIVLENNENTFYNNSEEEIADAKVKYLKTTLNKEELINILKIDGILTIKDIEGNILAELTTLKINANDFEETIRPTPPIDLDGEQQTLEDATEYTKVTINEENIEIEYLTDIENVIFDFKNITIPTIDNDDDEIKEGLLDELIEEEEELPNFVIKNTKSIYNVQSFDELNYLKENVNYKFTFINNEENEEQIDGHTENIIKFKDTVTRMLLETDKTEWYLGKTNTVNYTITLDTTSEKAELFVNPQIVLEMPDCVEGINSQNSIFTVENDNGVFTSKKVSTVSLLGKNYIIIKLDGIQSEESIVNGNTVINLSLELDIAETNEETDFVTKMYYKNDTVTAYENNEKYGLAELQIKLVLSSEEPVEQPAEQENNEDSTTENEQEENATPAETFYSHITIEDQKEGEEYIAEVGEEFEYLVYLYNTATEEVDIKVEDAIPEGLEYIGASLYNCDEYGHELDKVDITDSINYDVTTKTLTLAINNFDPATLVSDGTETVETYDEETGEMVEKTIELHTIKQAVKLLKIKVKPTKLAENEYIKEIDNNVIVYKNEVENAKLSAEITVSVAAVEYTISSLTENVKPEEFVEYTITIKNLGLFSSDAININVEVPSELELVRVDSNDSSYSINGNRYTDSVIVNGQETYIITIVAKYMKDLGENKTINVLLKAGEIEKDFEVALLTNEIPVEDFSNGVNNEENPTQKPDENTNEKPGENSNEKPSEKPGENPAEDTSKTEERTKGFDLSLVHNLNKITVTNSEGTTVYNYNNGSQFAKVEIGSKRMNGSIVTLEYKILVKNEGTIAGYARKIIDYLPEGIEFNSELNPDWYVGEDGNIYSVKYIDKLINPGETLELNLVLSKKMTNTNTGTIKNVAEIYEATNDLGVEDVNSIPGSKLENENDMSAVEVIIAVKTGTIITYVFLAVLVLGILVYGIYNVKKITLNKEDK